MYDIEISIYMLNNERKDVYYLKEITARLINNKAIGAINILLKNVHKHFIKEMSNRHFAILRQNAVMSQCYSIYRWNYLENKLLTRLPRRHTLWLAFLL